MEHRDHTGEGHPKNPPTHLKLRLFCRANWMPLTISGSSGTIASTVTPMKYCREMEVSKQVFILTASQCWEHLPHSKLLGQKLDYADKACPHPLTGRYPTQRVPAKRADEEGTQHPGPHPSPSQRNPIQRSPPSISSGGTQLGGTHPHPGWKGPNPEILPAPSEGVPPTQRSPTIPIRQDPTSRSITPWWRASTSMSSICSLVRQPNPEVLHPSSGQRDPIWGAPIPHGGDPIQRTPKSPRTVLMTISTLTCEMVELVRMGLMCSVARSAQADIQRVESRRMTSARQRDQWTTALWWWPGTGEE